MSLSSPGIAILFEHSEWFQPLFAELDRGGIPYDRLLAAELSDDPRARTSQYALVVNRMSPSAYRVGMATASSLCGSTCAMASRWGRPAYSGGQVYIIGRPGGQNGNSGLHKKR